MAPVRKAGWQDEGIGRTVCHRLHGLVPVHLDTRIVITVAETCGELDHAAGVGQGRTAWRAVIDGLAGEIVPALDAGAVVGRQREDAEAIGVENRKAVGIFGARVLAELGIGADTARQQEGQDERRRRNIGLAFRHILDRVGQRLAGGDLNIGNAGSVGELAKGENRVARNAVGVGCFGRQVDLCQCRCHEAGADGQTGNEVKCSHGAFPPVGTARG